MKEEAALNLVLALVNLALERAKTDPLAAAKVQAGDPLDMDDIVRLGVHRDLAGDELQEAIDEAENGVRN